MNDYLTTERAADCLGVSQARVRKLIQEGRLEAIKHGRDYAILRAAVEQFATSGRKKVGRPHTIKEIREPGATYLAGARGSIRVGNGEIFPGDLLEVLPTLDSAQFQTIIADPPYFQVLLEQTWDNTWASPEEYLEWTMRWLRECKRVLRPDGLLYVFGQPGKREHVWLHACSMMAREMQFHDMIVWDRAVGYNERSDSFTPQYEMIIALRSDASVRPYFNKDAVRISYDEQTIQSYLRDKRYKDREARERHLRKGKYATNIIRVPSLKGSSREKVGHPSQKPLALISQLILSSSRKGDAVLDPFLGSGTTAASAETLGRRWVGVEINADYVEISRKRIEAMTVCPELNLD